VTCVRCGSSSPTVAFPGLGVYCSACARRYLLGPGEKLGLAAVRFEISEILAEREAFVRRVVGHALVGAVA